MKRLYKHISQRKLLIISLCTFIGPFVVVAQKTVASRSVITYPAPPGLDTSTDFTVKVNSTDVWTERVGNPGMESLNVVNFSCAGPQTITVTARSAIKKYSIRPKSRSIKAIVKGRELTFTIQGPQKLYIEIDSLPHLAIFSNPPEDELPDRNDTNVIYYGPGIYSPGVINLKNNQ